MSVALPFAELPVCLQMAIARKPRQAVAARGRSAPENISQNNYLAEAPPSRPALGGGNAKGAGAPRGNRNAAGGALYRLRLKRIRLKKHSDQQRYHRLVLAAAITHLEALAAPAPASLFSQNNYLAQGQRVAAKPAAAPPPPGPCRYNNYLAPYPALPEQCASPPQPPPKLCAPARPGLRSESLPPKAGFPERARHG